MIVCRGAKEARMKTFPFLTKTKFKKKKNRSPKILRSSQIEKICDRIKNNYYKRQFSQQKKRTKPNKQ